jgi:hypothetical protein
LKNTDKPTGGFQLFHGYRGEWFSGGIPGSYARFEGINNRLEIAFLRRGRDLKC